MGYYAIGHQIEAYDGRRRPYMVYLARGRRLARSSSSFFVLAGRLQPVASYRFGRYVLLRPMILKRYGRTIKKGWSYQGKLISLQVSYQGHQQQL